MPAYAGVSQSERHYKHNHIIMLNRKYVGLPQSEISSEEKLLVDIYQVFIKICDYNDNEMNRASGHLCAHIG